MSKLLVIMRHGHAEMAEEDFERPLSSQGRAAAACVGELLVKQGLSPHLVLCSSAPRAATTAEELCGQFPQSPPLVQRKDLYLASSLSTLQVLQALNDRLKTVVLVGHNPGVSELAQLLLGRPVEFSPAQYICQPLSIHHWQQLGE